MLARNGRSLASMLSRRGPVVAVVRCRAESKAMHQIVVGIAASGEEEGGGGYADDVGFTERLFRGAVEEFLKCLLLVGLG